jgi:16S rRNA processing protein RimM
LLEIQGPNWKTAVLLPFTLEAVPTIDLKARRLITDPPVGLFE